MVCVDDLDLNSGLYGSLWDINITNISQWVSQHHIKYATLDRRRQTYQSLMNLASTLTNNISEL